MRWDEIIVHTDRVRVCGGGGGGGVVVVVMLLLVVVVVVVVAVVLVVVVPTDRTINVRADRAIND